MIFGEGGPQTTISHLTWTLLVFGGYRSPCDNDRHCDSRLSSTLVAIRHRSRQEGKVIREPAILDPANRH